jgi:tRNA dimethylallyltransferase
MQVYRYLNIGTGKPGAADREKVPHYLIDIVEPDDPYTAGRFVRDAQEACRIIMEHKKIPLFVGGTGLYLDAFFKGIAQIPEINNEIRQKVHRYIEEHGIDQSFQRLKEVDLELCETIDRTNPRRIARGLEVYEMTGVPLSQWQKSGEKSMATDVLYIALSPERQELYGQINKRVDDMMNQGWLDEVKGLKERGYTTEHPSLRALGYGELYNYLLQGGNLDEVVEHIKKITRNFAKRQLTWFRNRGSYRWFTPHDREDVRGLIEEWLNRSEIMS